MTHLGCEIMLEVPADTGASILSPKYLYATYPSIVPVSFSYLQALKGLRLYQEDDRCVYENNQ